MRTREILSCDSNSLEGLINMGAMKSELAGIQFAASLPEALKAELQDEIDFILETLRGEEHELVD